MPDAVLGSNESTNCRTTDDVFGEREAKTIEAIALEVANRRSQGLPIVVDRGNGVVFLP
jgi:hypothetical protein